MITQQKLKTTLESAGWRTERDPLRHASNECDWYAWTPVRRAGWPDCDCNDKPPSLSITPTYYTLPNGRGVDDVTISVTGEKAGRWFKLQMYCIKSDEAIAAAEEALLMLGAAWSAIAANASKEPSP